MSDVNKQQLYLYSAHAGAVLLVAFAVAYAIDAPDFLKGLFVGALLAIVVILFRHKFRDEYVERLWSAGTQLALIATLIGALGLELVHGFMDPAIDVFEGRSLLDAKAIGVMALASFFLGFHLEMWRNRA